MFRIKPKGTQPAWQGSAAAACFVIAVIAGLSGSLLTTNAILNAHEHPKLYAVGLISLIFALPIAILGAHCLDLIDRRQKKIERLLATSRFSDHAPGEKLSVDAEVCVPRRGRIPRGKSSPADGLFSDG